MELISVNTNGYKIGLGRFMTLISGQIPGVQSVGFIQRPDSKEKTADLEKYLRSGNCSFRLLRGRLLNERHLDHYYMIHNFHERSLLSIDNARSSKAVVHATVVEPNPLHLRFRLLKRNSGKLLGEKEIQVTLSDERLQFYRIRPTNYTSTPINFTRQGSRSDTLLTGCSGRSLRMA